MKFDVVFALEHAGWPALLVDEAGNVRHANAAAIQTLGSSVEGEPRLAAVWAEGNESSAEQFLWKWERSHAPLVTLKFRAKGGKAQAFSTAICSISRDEQKLYTLQLLPVLAASDEPGGDVVNAQKQKLECALQLARTVALDFNNALTSILGHTSLILSRIEPDNPWRGSLLEVEKSAEKAAEIANDLGSFSRQERDHRTQTANNLNQLLLPNIEAFKAAQADKVKWTVQLERRLFAAKFDEAKMQQAFIKILDNAVESIRDHGNIILQTRNIELTQATQDRNVSLAPGSYVCVEISDSGTGIEPDVLPRIFEPFFTTKRNQHRGLGLAWVYGIVTNHGGGVAVSSQIGVGTSVRVYLPAEKKYVRDSAIPQEELQGSETILMVDDEEMLLTMGRTVLSSFGYNVMTANSGHKALDMISKASTPIDLLITDLVMPNMSGRELVERVQRIAPAIRILWSSGFVRPNSEESPDSYIQKPFTSQELLLKVKETLANSTET